MGADPSLDLSLPDEHDAPLLSARNSALSLVDSLFSSDDEHDDDVDDVKNTKVDQAQMPQLRYSIGTSGDRRHLHRDIHCAHKQADFRGLDLHRALVAQARNAPACTQPVVIARIPTLKPALTRAKSSAALPTLLGFLGKRKSEPRPTLSELKAQYDSPPPKPRKAVSFADLRDTEDGEGASGLSRGPSRGPSRSGSPSRANSPSATIDAAFAAFAPAAEEDAGFSENCDPHCAPSAADEWGAGHNVWGWSPESLPQAAAMTPAAAMPFAMAPQMPMPMMMTSNGYLVAAPQPMAAQMAAVVYPPEYGVDAAGNYFAIMPQMQQMAQMPQQMPQMPQQMPQQMPPHMPPQMPPQMPQQMAWPMPMTPLAQQPTPQWLQYGAAPAPAPAVAAAPSAPAPAPLSASPPTAAVRGRGGAGDKSHSHTAATGARTRGALLAAAKEQQGSRRLQAELTRMSDAQLECACAELAPHLLDLATHTFGNYVVSKLAARPQAQAHLFSAVRGHVVELMQHAQGSRVVQAAIAELPSAEATALVLELDGHVFECALDTHGSWGVCVAFKQTHAPFILTQMARNMAALATQQHGIRVVQQVLNEAAASGMDVSAAVGALLAAELGFIAAHAYGNYAVQAALRHAEPRQREAMLGALLPRLRVLSRSKHGSNVAEMVLMRASSAQLEQMRQQIFGSEQLDELRELMESQYGNYVLQALLRRLDAGMRAAALQRIESQTKSTNYGRAILAAAGA